jgi:hypothetical protein
MSKLFAFGCSFTHGEGLADCLNYKKDKTSPIRPSVTPSQYAWPALLGKVLDKEVVNLGRPGCSNRYISQKILNTTIQKDDIVVVLWTEYNRTTVITSDENIHIRPMVETKLVTNYFKHIYDPYNSFLESVEAINLANYSLQNHQHVFNFKTTENKIELRNYPHQDRYPYPVWHRIELFEQPLYFIDIAPDDDHPGPKSQKLIARDMLERITNND